LLFFVLLSGRMNIFQDENVLCAADAAKYVYLPANSPHHLRKKQ